MKKRYQIFISSTFTDLQEERRKVIEAVMQLESFPAGMELFPATNDEQMSFITKVIDDSDYYVLVIGGRYGSENLEGISYTEKEYEYALSKGIPILAFLHKDIETIPFSKSEIDVSKRDKLQAFRKKVSTNRLVKFWSSAEELQSLVIASLAVSFVSTPRVGWIRGGNDNNYELLQQINQLRLEKEELLNNLQSLEKKVQKENTSLNLAKEDDRFTLIGTWSAFNGPSKEWSATFTWDTLFSIFGPHLLAPNNNPTAKSNLESAVKQHTNPTAFYFTINDDIYQTIKIHLLSLGLINVYQAQAVGGGITQFISLTDDGRDYLIKLKSVKKNLTNYEIEEEKINE